MTACMLQGLCPTCQVSTPRLIVESRRAHRRPLHLECLRCGSRWQPFPRPVTVCPRCGGRKAKDSTVCLACYATACYGPTWHATHYAHLGAHGPPRP